MRERAVSFGGGGLFGVVTEPDRADRDAPRDRPGVIVLNSGLLHKVGPYRLSVNLTRAIGKRGHYALRFDLSGIGDSRMTLSDLSARERAVADVGAAMDFMAEEYGVRAFVLMGLCSGSDNAHYTSLQDERVVGTVHLDGYAVPDWRYYLKYYGGRLLSLRVLRARFEKAQSEDVGRNRTPAAGGRTRVFPSRSQLTHDFKQVTDRGVRLLCIFTRGAEAYNYKGQMRRTFSAVEFGDLLEEEFFPLATHTYCTLESRRAVVARITHWVSRHWGEPHVERSSPPPAIAVAAR